MVVSTSYLLNFSVSEFGVERMNRVGRVFQSGHFDVVLEFSRVDLSDCCIDLGICKVFVFLLFSFLL